MDGNGRWANQRGLPRTAGHEAGEAGAARRRRRRDRGRREAHVGVRLLDRELAALAGGGALPDGLQPRRDPPPARPAARVGGAGALGRTSSPAVVLSRDSRARDRRGADARQRRDDADDVRQLRRPGRDRRRGAGDRADGRLRPARPERDRRAHGARFLDEPDLPDVDLFLRSSGEQRLSNFLLWQSAYAELAFDNALWPDVDRRHLWDALLTYAGRERRYGGAIDAPSV